MCLTAFNKKNSRPPGFLYLPVVGARDHFPVLGIHAFGHDLPSGWALQYHEIKGVNVIDKPHKHDFFTFLLFEKGNGSHSIDFVNYPVKSRQAHLLFPGQVHSWALGKNTMAYQLMISRNVFETFFPMQGFSATGYPVIDLGTEAFKSLLFELHAIKNELKLTTGNNDIVKLRSRLVLELTNREAEEKLRELKIYNNMPQLLAYRQLVDAHFKEHKTVTYYAGRLHITANYLNILCKKQLQVPAMSLIQQRVMLEAKRLILASNLTLKEIAFDLGFNDLAYFSNFFKSHAGMSPRQFKEGR